MGCRPEPKVRDRHGARLLGVVHEVALHEGAGLLDDDLDAVLVGPYRAVRAQPEEHGLDLAVGPGGTEVAVPGQAERAHVVEDADGEVALGPLGAELVEDGLGHGRRELLGGQPVPSADDAGRPGEGGSRSSMASSRAARTSRYSGSPTAPGSLVRSSTAIERTLGGRAETSCCSREGPVKPDRHQPDPLARLDEAVDGFARRAHARAHHHDDAFGVGGAVVLDQAVGAPGPCRQGVHGGLDDAGDGAVVRVGGLPALEVHVRVLRRAPHVGSIGAHPPEAELDEGVGVDQRRHVLGRQRGDLRQFVGRPETVEEVQERYPRLQGGGVGDQGEVMSLLDRVGGQHGPSRCSGRA